MPNDPQLSRMENAWLKFVRNLRDVLVVQSDDRPLDQYLAFRDQVLELVESQDFLAEDFIKNYPLLKGGITLFRELLNLFK